MHKIIEPTVRMTPGAYGPMLYAACLLCEWHGRQRDPNGRSRVKGQIRTLSFAESREHMLAKHGHATLDDAIREAKVAAGLDPDAAHLPALWADRLTDDWSRLFWAATMTDKCQACGKRRKLARVTAPLATLNLCGECAAWSEEVSKHAEVVRGDT